MNLYIAILSKNDTILLVKLSILLVEKWKDNGDKTLLLSEGPVMSWRLVQGAPCPRPETRLGLAPAPRDPMERDKRLRIMTWHDMTHKYVMFTKSLLRNTFCDVFFLTEELPLNHRYIIFYYCSSSYNVKHLTMALYFIYCMYLYNRNKE